MTSLPMPTDVEAVALGPGGIGESAKAGAIYIDQPVRWGVPPGRGTSLPRA